MDTTKTVTHIGLCAGYGGIELGLQRAIPNLRTVALCEIEAFAVANLVAKMEAGLMDPAPIWPNLKTFPWESFRGRVDILTGGYPCQPFSAAGQRKGKDDPRHLWPWIADGIRLLQPQCCFFENVEGHISLGLSDVIEDLAGMGYRTTWGLFSAAECGAPHQRKRVFILAHDGNYTVPHQWSRFIDNRGNWQAADLSLEAPHQSSRPSGCEEWRQDASSDIGLGGSWGSELAESSGIGGASGFSGSIQRNEGKPGESNNGRNQGQPWPSRPGEQQHGWEPPRVVGDTENQRSRTLRPEHEGQQRQSSTSGTGGSERLADDDECRSYGRADGSCGRIGQSCEASEDAAGSGSTSDGMRKTQSSLGGDPDGTSNRMDDAQLYVSCDNRTDELRLLGNGVVPATAEKAFRTLINELLGN